MGANSSHHEPLGDYQRPHASSRPASHARASIRKSLRKKKREKREERENNKENQQQDDQPGDQPHQQHKVEGVSGSRGRRMDRLRRSFRESFRKKKDHVTEASKPHQWQTDEASVRAGTCSFPVKYLGCVEVFESRGMQVCEEALKVLRNSRRRPVRGMLYVSGDGLRVVDDETKGLIVDQTIEKVSFCAPDRNHEKGFSYICRDGTTRRWMCHGFFAVKETVCIYGETINKHKGERLSHAVGCAFAACLERKQKRDKECGVTMSFDPATSTFTRSGSFRQMTVTERLSDPQECKPIEPVPVKKVENPHAIARPHATPLMLQRQGSFRVFQHLNQAQSPFKRQLSLRLNDLPSNLERTRSMSLDNSAAETSITNNNNMPPESPQPPPRTHRNRLHSLPNAVNMTPIPESSPVVENKTGDAVSAMCQELSAGLSLLSNFTDPFSSPENTSPAHTSHPSAAAAYTNPASQVLLPDVEPIREENPWAGTEVNGHTITSNESGAEANQRSLGEEWLSQFNTQAKMTNGTTTPPLGAPVIVSESGPIHRSPPLAQLRSASLGATTSTSTTTTTSAYVGTGRDAMSSSWTTSNGTGISTTNNLMREGAPITSSGNGTGISTSNTFMREGAPITSGGGGPGDPFDAEWAALAARNANPNNPFLPGTVTKAFEVQM